MSSEKDSEEESIVPEEGIPMEQAAPAPASNQDSFKKGPLLALLALLALVFALGVAGTAVGSVALKKANDVDSELDQLTPACEEGPMPGATFPPISQPSPHLTFVPDWNYTDLSWFAIPGNRMIYNEDPMYEEGTEDFATATPIGALTGECLITKLLTDPTDFPVAHCYLTGEFNGIPGRVTMGGISEISGAKHKISILGGTGYWGKVSGYVEAQFNIATGQYSSKIYQTCQ